jgi:predicted  nucleic acid-binding Zn-ribbon protein
MKAPAGFSVRSIGGIEETTVELRPGVNVLTGRNATNRTSFLKAIMAALGSNDVSVKGDADEAEVGFEFKGTTYERTLRRENMSVVSSGDSYLDNVELAELFAFLLESNEARQTVLSNGDLRDIIMRPVDLAEIKSEISRLESEKQRLDKELEAIEQRKQELPDLESRRSRLQSEIAETKEKLSNKEAEIENSDADVQAKREEQEQLEEQLDDLRETRTELEDVRYEIDTERESIESLEQELSQLDEELEQLPSQPSGDRDKIQSQIEQLRTRRQALESKISSLQSTIQFNEEMLEGDRTDVAAAFSADEEGDVTDELLPDGEVTCWTCGSDVQQAQIEETLDQLRSLRKSKLDEKRELTAELDDLKTDKQSLDQQRERGRKIERRRDKVEDEIDHSEDRLETLREQRSDLQSLVEELESEVEALESDQFDEILDLHREANELEYELGRLENDLESVESEVTKVEDRIDEQSKLEAERADIQAELTDLRTRVDQLEEGAVEQFNEHMEDVLDQLEYENLDRIWIERVQREVREGRQKNIRTFFELHVVRSTPSGTTYEDTIDHLSESEREVTGLVFALAGYLVHEVHEAVPFMLLDSLEAIDSERIAELVDYFSEYADFLAVALLPEDASALNDTYHRIESI